jgi:FkbM family methyltransferase
MLAKIYKRIPLNFRKHIKSEYSDFLFRTPIIGRPLSRLIWGKSLDNLSKTSNGMLFKTPTYTLHLPRYSLSPIVLIHTEKVYDKEPKVLLGDTVVDIGAHAGVFTFKIASLAKQVVAIEPDPSNYRFLLENISLNTFSNILPVNYAIGTKDSTEAFYSYGLHSGKNAYKDYKLPKELIRVRTLTSVLKSLRIPKVDYIKISVGMSTNLEVLEGCKEVIEDSPKIKMVIAVGWSIIYNRLEPIKLLLRDLGLKFYQEGLYIYAVK